MAVPFNNPGRAISSQRAEIEGAIARVLDSGCLILGPENEALSEDLSRYLGVRHTVLVGNGTDALEIALRAVGVGPGDTVLTAANAGGYASTAAALLGATPSFVDIDPDSLQMDPESLSSALSVLDGRVKAVVVTHLYGQVADVEAIAALCTKAGVALVEDCAQALGARVRGKPVGTFGDVSTTSFYPTKNLGALGDGGAIFTQSDEMAETVTQLRQYGWADRYRSVVPGGQNSRLDEIQAAVLRVRLAQLDELTERRRAIHSRYRSVSSPWGTLPHLEGEGFVAHLAVMVTDEREQLVSHLTAAGIQTAIHYPIPDHHQPAFWHAGEFSLPVTEDRARKILSLPLFPELTEEEITRVMDALASGEPQFNVGMRA